MNHQLSLSTGTEEIYHSLALESRKVRNNLEAAVKLLVERGQRQDDGYLYSNSDYYIMGQGNAVLVKDNRAFSSPGVFFKGNALTGETYASNITLERAGKLQALANGEALMFSYPDLMSLERTSNSAAKNSLGQINFILTFLCGEGSQKLIFNQYTLNRSEDLITVLGYGSTLLLRGNYSSCYVSKSYLSEQDILNFNHFFYHLVRDDHEKAVEIERIIYGHSHADGESPCRFYLEGDWKSINQSWEVPLGGAPDGYVDNVTARGALNACSVITKANNSKTYQGDLYFIDDAIETMVFDKDDNKILEGLSYCNSLIVNKLTTSMAYELMYKARLYQPDFLIN